MDGDTIVLQTTDNARKHVNLVAVDAGDDPNNLARNFLSELVLNQPVRVMANKTDSETVVGVVKLDLKDVNRAMLEAGVVKHRSPEAYAVSAYTNCVYTKVEEKAREAKKGIWSF